jgi:hypothetical protein
VNQKYTLFALSLGLFLCACASNDKKSPVIDEYLATQITNDNIKHFSYSAEMFKPSSGGSMAGRSGKGSGGGRGGMGGGRGGMGGGGGKGGGARPDPEEMKKKMEKSFDLSLANKLDELGYCREGYEVLDKTIGRAYAQYRGQCNELASEEDIEKFRSKQPGPQQQTG